MPIQTVESEFTEILENSQFFRHSRKAYRNRIRKSWEHELVDPDTRQCPSAW